MKLASLGPTVLCSGDSMHPPGLYVRPWSLPSITVDVGRTDLPDSIRLVVAAS